MSVATGVDAVTVRRAFEALGALFLYPDHERAMAFESAALYTRDVDEIAAASLEELEVETSTLSITDLQSVYTATFDLAPSCSPYLGDWLFDEECGDRARLMVGLRARMREGGGGDEMRELPDHVAVVLGSAAVWSDEEWGDLGRFVLLPGLAKMNACLEPTRNPYRHLVVAAYRLASAAFPEGDEA